MINKRSAFGSVPTHLARNSRRSRQRAVKATISPGMADRDGIIRYDFSLSYGIPAGFAPRSPGGYASTFRGSPSGPLPLLRMALRPALLNCETDVAHRGSGTA